MSRSVRKAFIALGVCVGILAGALVIYRYYTSPEQAGKRAERMQQAKQHERFIAKFDSLKEARLYPTAWRSGAFTRTRFDDNREEWTLTISSADWERRDEASKVDLVTRLHTTFRGVRAQAGGDPETAILVIESEQEEELAGCSPESGVMIHR
jgi:hypothetical protein